MLQEHLHDLLEHAEKPFRHAPFLDHRALVERDLLAAEASVGDVMYAAVWTCAAPESDDAALI